MAKLEDLREWLLDRIDGGEEMRGEDGLISDFIRQIDALPSEIAEPRGCPTPGACSALAELADLKQRLLPQFAGRAQRAEHERDGMHEKLMAARSAIGEAAQGHARYEYLRTLNPREFAALYDEALHGTADNFDDLVDRYRMKGEPVDHGYDRTASLNAGRYVCTCGGACSSPDARGAPRETVA